MIVVHGMRLNEMLECIECKRNVNPIVVSSIPVGYYGLHSTMILECPCCGNQDWPYEWGMESNRGR
jgi:hypothetical protein